MKKKAIIIIGTVAVILSIVLYVTLKSGEKEINLNTAVVARETIQSTVTATGYVQPVDKVDVGTQVSGVIEKIYVDFNSQVKKGQLLAELDKLTLNERLIQAEASVNSAQSDLNFVQQNYDRVKQLYDVKAATEASFEDATNRLVQSNTSLANARANLHQAKVNLSYAEIYSPINGVVLNRAVEQGQTVAASFNTPTLFTIANDLTKMQVEANVDEADIGQVKVGQEVTFTVDAYSDYVFTGSVKQIRLQPTVTSNVVTYTVIIDAPNPEEKLFPGMTASVTIITHAETGLVVPAEALNTRFLPDVIKKLDIQENTSNIQKGIWIKTSGGIIRKQIKVGTSDGIHVIIEEGLQIGDTIVLSASFEKNIAPSQAANPLMPRRPQSR